jgi:hypothetical protein
VDRVTIVVKTEVAMNILLTVAEDVVHVVPMLGPVAVLIAVFVPAVLLIGETSIVKVMPSELPTMVDVSGVVAIVTDECEAGIGTRGVKTVVADSVHFVVKVCRGMGTTVCTIVVVRGAEMEVGVAMVDIDVSVAPVWVWDDKTET